MSLSLYTFSVRSRYAPILHARLCGPRVHEHSANCFEVVSIHIGKLPCITRADGVPTCISTHSELSVCLHVFACMKSMSCFSICLRALRAASVAACACIYHDWSSIFICWPVSRAGRVYTCFFVYQEPGMYRRLHVSVRIWGHTWKRMHQGLSAYLPILTLIKIWSWFCMY